MAKKPIEKQMRARLIAVFVLLIALFLGIVSRLFYIAYYDSDWLKVSQTNQVNVEREITPPRGDILDRNGKPLAKDTPLVRIVCSPKQLHIDWCYFGAKKCLDNPKKYQKQRDNEFVRLTKVAEALSMDVSKLENIIRKNANSGYKVLLKEAPPHFVQQNSAIKALWPYFFLENYYRRFYPLKESSSNLLGVVNYEQNGISGVEKAFNQHLKSKPGKVLEKYSGDIGLKGSDAGGKQKNIFYSEMIEPAVEGKPLRLSIDSYLQYSSYKHLAQDSQVFGAKDASAIIIDVATGEILAMADYPGTNTNDRGNVKFDYTVSPAITETLEPGSAIKPLVMAGLLNEGLVRANESVETSPGHIYIDKWLVKDVRNFGTLGPGQIIEKSSNIGMIKLAKRIEGDAFSHFFNSLGFNETTGAFPGIEMIGDLGNAWESDVTKLNQSYGYGLDATLLALARSYLILARKGELIPLTIVAGNQYQTKVRVIDADVAEQVMDWMTLVVGKRGTGSKGAISNMSIAGKTGTARAIGFAHDTNEKYNNNFVGIFPADNPKLLVVVAYRSIFPPYHYAGNSSVVTFKKIATQAINYLDID